MAAEITNSASAIVFGPFHLRPAARLLEKSGEPVRLGGRALDILIALVERPGEVVSHQQLFTRVWPKVQVVEGALRVHMMVLRRALGEGEDGARYVTNIPGRGYCFVAPIFGTSEVSGGQDEGAPQRPASEASPMLLPPTNLPQHLTSLIGRSAELAELRELFVESRLVTLVGSGGIGKTRLAIELGWDLLRRFPDGVWLIDLAPLSRPELVVIAVAIVLGVSLDKTDMAIETIAAAIGRQRLLLIFDNCEHLLSAAAVVEALLKHVPGLSVLVTSQERLRIPSETVYRLDPLALPPPAAVEIAGFGAVALFVERARGLDRRFTLDAGNAAAVAEICRRLDGIPLALEMAAARLPLLGLEGLRAGLQQRLRMLKAGGPVTRSRHRTLLGMLDWSFGLLEPWDQEVFRRLAIFAGDFSLDAAIAVAGQGEADRWDILDALSRLIDKSLVTFDDVDQPRYRLLETLRIYARERLSASGEGQAIARRHAGYFLDFLGPSDEISGNTPHLEWLKTYAPEVENVRAALDWAGGDLGDRLLAIKLASASYRLWLMVGRVAEGQRHLEQTTRLVDDSIPRAEFAMLVARTGNIWRGTDRARSLAFFQQAAALYRELGDQVNLAHMLSFVGDTQAQLGHPTEAKPVLHEALALLQASESTKPLFGVICSLGNLARMQGAAGEARDYYERALALAQDLNDDLRQGYVLRSLGEVEFVAGAVDRAITLAREATSRMRANAGVFMLSEGLINLASYLAIGQNVSEAWGYAEEALALARDAGGITLRICLQLWALLGAQSGLHVEAARLKGFIDASTARHGDIREPTEQQVYDRLSAILAGALLPAECRAAAVVGAGWTDEQAADFTVGSVFPHPPDLPMPPVSPKGPLLSAK